ncbi:hypothetical protein PPYR_14608 [Photinus pyralis]|uniref:Ionotropic glutamate receptor C-terminal domain-containing protein n=3 Tax=Photinus pyralis TaxID=7054 RepID=A0A5N4A5V8_PHOPY|nr:glutamate receptor ionotropic, kainate 2-like [Photinus pyralis]XP_031357034.1 glutamate receptor ionotropic, kainate 2-like [Photinus pyralis]KAB0792649.1 hypothetical protein PPYR_14608 [Photinus pyralis]
MCKLVFAQLVGLISVALFRPGLAAYGDPLTIGALFSKDNSEVELAFKYAVQWHNIYSSEGTHYLTDVRKVPVKNMFTTSKIVCNMTNTRPGVIAIFGYESARTSPMSRSVCKKLEIPYIETKWKSTKYPPLIALNFYPAADLLAEGFATILRHMNWKSYAIVYQNEKDLVTLQGILKIPDVSDYPVIIKQLEHDPEGPDARSMFKQLKDGSVSKVILNCHVDDILSILMQAKEIGFLTMSTNIFLTSLDAHTLDYGPLNTTANITMVRLFNPANENLIRHVQSWEVGEMRRNRHFSASPGTVKTTSALMIDAVNLLIESVNHLHKTEKIRPRPMHCDESDTWEGGYRIAAYMKEHHLPNPITGPILFDDFGRRINFTLHVVELNADVVKATWSPSNGTRLNMTLSAQENRQLILKSLQKQRIVVSSKILAPYLMYRNRSNLNEDVGSKYEGYVADLIEKIAEELKFTYEFYLTPDTANGNYDENSQTWNGIMGDVISGVAQLGVSDLTVNHQRRQFVDFSNYFMTLGISILYKTPDQSEANMFAFKDPLSDDVWMYTATAFLGLSIMLYMIARMAPGDWQNPHPCETHPEELENIWNLGNSLWLTMGSIMTQGCDILPKGISSRMAVAMWWFFSLLMTSSYTANLAAYLAKERMGPSINNLDDLLNQNKIKFGTLINGTTYEFFRTSNYSKHKAVWEKMSNFKPSPFVSSNPEGVKKVLNKNQEYAFFMESSTLEYERNKECELIKIGDWLDSKGYGIAMPLDAPYRSEINNAILKFQESGELQTLKNKWWKELNEGEICEEVESEIGEMGLKLQNVGGVFWVLGVGVGISFMISIVEFLWNVRNVSVQDHITYCEALAAEFKFAINFWVTKKAARVEVKEPSQSREGSETRSMAGKMLQGAGSFLRLETIFDRMSVSRND